MWLLFFIAFAAIMSWLVYGVDPAAGLFVAYIFGVVLVVWIIYGIITSRGPYF